MSFARPFRRSVRTARRVVGAVAAAALAACGSDAATAPAPIPIEQQTWATSLGITLSQFTRLNSGVYYLDTQVGTGTTITGTPTVAVEYVGYLANGAKFDERTTPICFSLAGLIPGWQQGMQGMRVTGRRRLLIPPALGYGSGGNGSIPGNANLVFDIRLTGTGCTPT